MTRRFSCPPDSLSLLALRSPAPPTEAPERGTLLPDRDRLSALWKGRAVPLTVTSQIKRIRAPFVAVDASFAALQTVCGMGYRWQAD